MRAGRLWGGVRTCLTSEQLKVREGLGEDPPALLLHRQRDHQQPVGQLREVLDEVVLPVERSRETVNGGRGGRGLQGWEAGSHGPNRGGSGVGRCLCCATTGSRVPALRTSCNDRLWHLAGGAQTRLPLTSCAILSKLGGPLRTSVSSSIEGELRVVINTSWANPANC